MRIRLRGTRPTWTATVMPLLFFALLTLSPLPVRAESPPNPEAASAVAVSSLGDYALVTNSADGALSVISVATGSIVNTVEVGDALGGRYNSAPGCIAITPNNRWGLVGYERPGGNQLIVLAIEAIGDGIDGNEIVNSVDLRARPIQRRAPV